MNVDKLIFGLSALLLGLVGLVIESSKSARENRERGWDLTRTKFVLGIWSLIISGTLLTIFGLLDKE
jgi:glucose uptake protein GlcU